MEEVHWINHYTANHSNVPLWIMVQILTLGQFAHFYNYRTKDSIADTLVHEKLKILKCNQRYQHGKNVLFAEVVILKYLLDNEDFKDFHNELGRCFKKYKPNDEVIAQMGFFKIGKV